MSSSSSSSSSSSLLSLFLLSLLVALASSSSFFIDPTGGRPKTYNGPDKIHQQGGVQIPLFSGIVVNQPQAVFVFWDYTVYAHGSLTFELHKNGVFHRNCTYTESQIHFEYVEITWNPSACYLDAPGSYEAVVDVTRRTTGAQETFRFDITLLPTELKPWPLENTLTQWPPKEPNLAANLVHNYQSFSGASSAYWHEGVDIRSSLLPGTQLGYELHSPVAGQVVQWVRYSSSDLYWSLMVRESRGLVWQFHHLDPDTVTVKIGDNVAQGQVLGNIAFWPSSHNGALYHHVHMNVAIPHPSWTSIPNPYVNGWQYMNSLRLLDNGDFTGGIKPASNGIFYFLRNAANTALAASTDAQTPRLSGDIDIVINLYSEFEETNSVPGHPYHNGIYEVGYSVEPLNKHKNIPGAVVVGEIPESPLIRVDKTPNEWSYNLPDFTTADSDTMLRRVYKQSFTYGGRSFSSVFTYQERTLYYIVTNTYRGEPDEANGFWDTDQLIPGTNERRFPNGDYLVKVYAIDEYGNRLDLETEVTVAN